MYSTDCRAPSRDSAGHGPGRAIPHHQKPTVLEVLMSVSPTLAHRIAAYAARLKFEDIPAAAVHEAKRRFIDSFATAVGAMPSDAFAIAREVCAAGPRASPGRRSSAAGRRASSGRRSSTACSSATSTSTTPICRRSRPTRATTWPRSWPSARWSGPAARTMITAAVLAYEIQCRLCDAASLRKHGVDHVTYGAISSAVAAASCWGWMRSTDRPRDRAGRRVQRRAAADAVRRAEHVEGLRLRQRRPQRRLRGDAGRRRA